jgi:multidrug efflux pump subunit AcrB
MTPLLRSKRAAWGFMGVMALLMFAAMVLPAMRAVPLKMLPFDNKNELLLVLDFDEGTTLERSDAAVRGLEAYLAGVPEVTDFTSYVGVNSPIDFNGMVRHYYLRRGANMAEIRVDLVSKKHRSQQSHAVGLRLRDDLTRLARAGGANLKIVELPPGPPVISTLVAEIYGRPDHAYEDLIAAARTVRARMELEPGVVDVDDSVEATWRKWVFVTDKEKAALNGVSVEDIAETIGIALGGATAGTVRVEGERNPLRIELRVQRALRSSAADLASIRVAGGGQSSGGQDARPTPSGGGAASTMVPLAELGRWEEATVDRTIYHKNLQRLVYVFAETAGRQPAECVIDIQADQQSEQNPSCVKNEVVPASAYVGSGWVEGDSEIAEGERTYFASGGGCSWYVPDGIRIDFAGEGEWQITLDVFRDLGIAFAAALVGIYILLVAQMRSFLIPVVVMLAIPLTVIGIMPGFWLLNLLSGGQAGGYADPILFTATAMIGMIALSGIVTRQAVIIIDFVHLAQRRGHTLFDAILASCAVRLRPILLTVGTAMLSALPITLDPIFSGLAWSLIFGLFASTVFTLFVIPVAYWLVFGRRSAAAGRDA